MSDEFLKADCGRQETKSPCATTTSATRSGSRMQGFASFGALLSACIASSGCWLPPLLILGGISGAGMTTFVAAHRGWLMILTFSMLGLAFYFTYSSPRRSAITALNKVMLWGVTLAVLGSMCIPPTQELWSSSEELTPEMVQTEIRIQGITGHSGVPKVEQALRAAPGVLAVKVDYPTKLATVGTRQGSPRPGSELLDALRSAGLQGEIVNGHQAD